MNSYHDGYAWTDDIVRGIRTTLAASSLDVDLDLEYLDWHRHPEAEVGESFAAYLRRKFLERQPELIIATDDPAVRLLLRHRSDLFPAVPVVFCGVNEFRGSSAYVSQHPEQHPWMTGVLETVDLDATVDLALRLHPATRTIVTVGEDEDTGYTRVIAARHPGLAVRSIPAQHLELSETARRLEALQNGTLVIFSAFSHDRSGRPLSIADSATFVSRHTKVPIYSVSKPTLGRGVVGGKMTDSFSQGQTAALLAISVLKGTPPAVLGIDWQDVNTFEFDYRQLDRWHIPESLLPAGSIIANRPRSFYSLHPFLFWTVGCFVVLQFAIILFLLLQRRRRQAAEAALRAHSQQLAQSNYMLEQFAYITAHDFQEPIRSVALFAELLDRNLNGKIDDQGRQSIDFVLEHSRRLHSMVRGLLEWVRAVEAPADSQLSCESQQLLDEAIAANREPIERNRARVSSETLPRVSMHAHHMGKLLNHLLQNAIQHGGTEPIDISVSAQREPDAWKFLVHNSGASIPAQLQSRIFGVFRRLEGNQEGIGMGLAICRRIVDYYGGRIWVESAAGQGCTFYFTVPDTVRPRARRTHWLRLQSVTYPSSHAHSDR